MAVSATYRQLLVCLVVLLAADLGCDAACSTTEVAALMSCLVPYNTQIVTALGMDKNKPCNQALISSSDLCTSFDAIVICVNGKDVSNTECRPVGVARINQELVVPCKIEDFVAACPDATAIDEGSTGGCRGEGVTLPVLVTSLMAAFLLRWKMIQS